MHEGVSLFDGRASTAIATTTASAAVIAEFEPKVRRLLETARQAQRREHAQGKDGKEGGGQLTQCLAHLPGHGDIQEAD